MITRSLAVCRGNVGRLLLKTGQTRPNTGLAQARVQSAQPWLPPVVTSAKPVELSELDGMKSSDLRRLSQAAASEGAHPTLWNAIARRCEDFGEQMRHWDIIHVLQAFTDSRVENKQLFVALGDALCSKTSKFPPKHILDVFAVYEAVGLRPRALYVELFHATIRLSRSMYAEELSLTLQCLARHRLGNPTVVAHLVSATFRQLRDVRLRYLCQITGALGDLQMVPDKMLEEFDGHAKFEAETVAVQELLENLQAFPQLEYSWRPYEELCLQQFRERVAGMTAAGDIEQLADPFEAMHFLRARGLLEKPFLEALTQWCLATVHSPNVRSQRRPTARQLCQLQDRCQEYGLDSAAALQDAISYYVESGGGQWMPALPRPLKWNRGRRYIKTDDDLEGVVGYLPHSENDELGDTLGLHGVSRHSTMPDLPGLPSSGFVSSAVAMPLPQRSALSSSVTGLKLAQQTADNMKKCGGETCGAFITSRRSVRPRHRRDPGLKRILRKNWHRAPLFMLPGFASRPKYRPGVATREYPWAGDLKGTHIVGARGGAWVLRR